MWMAEAEDASADNAGETFQRKTYDTPKTISIFDGSGVKEQYVFSPLDPWTE